MTAQNLRSTEARRSEPAAPVALLDQLPGALMLLDALGRIEYVNGTAALRLHALRSELSGRDLFREVLPQLESEGWGDRYRAGMAAGRASLSCEAVPARAGAGRVALAIRSFVHEGKAGAFVLLEDRAAQAVEAERRQRTERLAAVGELATGVAHEVNNPLASIKGFAQLLARELTAPDHAHALEIISQECSRAAGVIDKLLHFADEQRATTRGPLSLSELVGGMLDLRQYALETSGIEVRRELDPTVSQVHGERSALQRAVLALLTYAEQSLDRREGARTLTARTRESTDGVAFYLADNGPGIPREQLKGLFTDPDAGAAGDGPGLRAAFGIVRDHGGHLWADSVEGEGAMFCLRLPRWEAAPVEDMPPAEVPQPTLRGLPERPLRVLVAADEATLRLAIALFLGRHGHEVVQAADADEALQIVSQRSFDVVLADARMPGDGVSLLQTLDSMPALQGRTILMAGLHPQDGEPDTRFPGRPCLRKPFAMAEVVRLLQAVGS